MTAMLRACKRAVHEGLDMPPHAVKSLTLYSPANHFATDDAVGWKNAATYINLVLGTDATTFEELVYRTQSPTSNPTGHEQSFWLAVLRLRCERFVDLFTARRPHTATKRSFIEELRESQDRPYVSWIDISDNWSPGGLIGPPAHGLRGEGAIYVAISLCANEEDLVTLRELLALFEERNGDAFVPFAYPYYLAAILSGNPVFFKDPASLGFPAELLVPNDTNWHDGAEPGWEEDGAYFPVHYSNSLYGYAIQLGCVHALEFFAQHHPHFNFSHPRVPNVFLRDPVLAVRYADRTLEGLSIWAHAFVGRQVALHHTIFLLPGITYYMLLQLRVTYAAFGRFQRYDPALLAKHKLPDFIGYVQALTAPTNDIWNLRQGKELLTSTLVGAQHFAAYLKFSASVDGIHESRAYVAVVHDAYVHGRLPGALVHALDPDWTYDFTSFRHYVLRTCAAGGWQTLTAMFDLAPPERRLTFWRKFHLIRRHWSFETKTAFTKLLKTLGAKYDLVNPRFRRPAPRALRKWENGGPINQGYVHGSEALAEPPSHSGESSDDGDDDVWDLASDDGEAEDEDDGDGEDQLDEEPVPAPAPKKRRLYRGH